MIIQAKKVREREREREREDKIHFNLLINSTLKWSKT